MIKLTSAHWLEVSSIINSPYCKKWFTDDGLDYFDVYQVMQNKDILFLSDEGINVVFMFVPISSSIYQLHIATKPGTKRETILAACKEAEVFIWRNTTRVRVEARITSNLKAYARAIRHGFKLECELSNGDIILSLDKPKEVE